ncbi:Bug family tripartite tricarboxylate transporter substrate binding protein [Falsiroseomonas selenitidurans]|uniref:Tripartite tricarboxylate transporter substrate binding protein n=1 Tax=Falsiroseomonas selenitidurans TaxID=2716335 RepID=A0ABX1E9Q1_9PROT|nr:tripartite tricarboxylate transporter substrate-binding protein [Falsiroseomonas selenitidurans]NKC33949.1 tripartite tricarboxylate transporter substrate binding protein [Falsiroseomonas selenitidurans]
MFMRRGVLGLALAAGVALPALAFPDRTITLAVGFAPGGSTDITSRLLADRMGPALGPNGRVVVENRPGASGIIASDWLRRQAPDGHTLMLVEASSHALAPAAMVGGTRYDPVADFTHIAVVGTGPMIVVAQPNLPAGSPAAMLARMREGSPDALPFASSGVASMPHLSGELFANVMGLGGRFPHVAYRSGGQMVESIAKAETQWGVAVLASAAGQVRDGRVRGVAVTGLQRFPSFPDIPTLNETAMPGFDLENWFAVIGPKDMPAPVVAQLNAAIQQALGQAQLRERLLVAGVAPWSRPNAAADASAFFRAEVAKFRDVVARTGVKLEP